MSRTSVGWSVTTDGATSLVIADFLYAMQAVAHPEFPPTIAVTSAVASTRYRFGRTLQQRYATLSRREREVMERVVVEWLNKQVAVDLDISEITVKAHRGRMMQKMKARSLPDLVRMAARLRLAG